MPIKNPHFYTPFNFGALPPELSGYENSRVVILPVPYDATTTYKPGARDGPRAIIDASRALEFYDEEADANFSEIGISTLDELETLDSAEENVNRVYEAIRTLIADGKRVVMLGGEHSISSGAVRAFREQCPALSVLHIDAHADMREEIGGNRYNHGSVARRISEMCPLVSVGVRSVAEEEIEHIRRNADKISVYFAKDIRGGNGWMGAAIGRLGQDVYVTIDLDALDPSIMPAVGTPQPGGMTWDQLLAFLRKLSVEKNVVGFDVTELMPLPGMHAPEFLAAKLVYKLIGAFYYSKIVEK
jgi:agmatinase